MSEAQSCGYAIELGPPLCLLRHSPLVRHGLPGQMTIAVRPVVSLAASLGHCISYGCMTCQSYWAVVVGCVLKQAECVSAPNAHRWQPGDGSPQGHWYSQVGASVICYTQGQAVHTLPHQVPLFRTFHPASWINPNKCVTGIVFILTRGTRGKLVCLCKVCGWISSMFRFLFPLTLALNLM